MLDAYRAAAADQRTGVELQTILVSLSKAGLRIEGGELKRTPQPYPQDHPRAALLRRKGLHAWRDVTDPALIASEGLYAQVMTTFELLAPLVNWLSDL